MHKCRLRLVHVLFHVPVPVYMMSCKECFRVRLYPIGTLKRQLLGLPLNAPLPLRARSVDYAS